MQNYLPFFDSLGLDLNSITVNNNEEEDLDEATSKKKPKKKKKKIVPRYVLLDIPDDLDKRLLALYEQGKDLKDWYEDISSLIFNSLSESDAVLLLLLISATSPRTLLERNFKDASVIFNSLKDDIENNIELLRKFAYEQFTTDDSFSYNEDSTYYKLKITRAMQKIKMRDVSTKIPNFQRIVRYLFDNNFELSREQTVAFYVKAFNPYSKASNAFYKIGKPSSPKNSEDTDVLSSFKVYNFALNLLSPSYYMTKYNVNWYFVTIDTWMLKAFFSIEPDMSLSDDMTKYYRGLIMGRAHNYFNYAKRINQLAKSVGIEPQQLQAAIWVATLRKAKGANYSLDFVSTLSRISSTLEEANYTAENYANTIKFIVNNLDKSYFDGKFIASDDDYEDEDEVPIVKTNPKEKGFVPDMQNAGF